MDIDKLVKGVQIIVKQEMKEERNKLLKVVKEAVKRETSSLKKENKKLKKKIKLLEEQAVKSIQERPVQKGSTFMDDDPNESLDNNSINVSGDATFSSNPVINDILSETAQNYKPSNPYPEQGQPQQPQQINEVSGDKEGMEEWPTMKHNMKPQVNQGVGMSQGGAEQVKQNMRAQMEAQFKGQGGGSGAPSPNGLGVNTGIAGLDRVLNRDNSELVKKFDEQKKNPYRPGNGTKEW